MFDSETSAIYEPLLYMFRLGLYVSDDRDKRHLLPVIPSNIFTLFTCVTSRYFTLWFWELHTVENKIVLNLQVVVLFLFGLRQDMLVNILCIEEDKIFFFWYFSGSEHCFLNLKIQDSRFKIYCIIIKQYRRVFLQPVQYAQHT
jgi:hypothetical protein